MYKIYCLDKNCRCEKKKTKELRNKIFSSLKPKTDDFADELDKINTLKKNQSTKL